MPAIAKKNSSSSLPSVTALAVAACTLVAIAWGWQQRQEYWITAESGLGYAFGIAGGVMMLLLLLYPLSKKSPFLRRVLATRFWFKGHMLFGIAGPTLILFHSNFNIGSKNSSVALFSMLLVVFSGLVGRYLYRHIHNGLYGQQISYQELRNRHTHQKSLLQQHRISNKTLHAKLEEIENIVDNDESSLTSSFRKVRKAGKKSRQLYKYLAKMHTDNPQEKELMQAFQNNVKNELQVLQSMVDFSLYTKLFSIWHVVHLPFFYMLIVTAIVHVIVVHMY